MMKTAWGKPVHVIPFCRTLLIVLAVVLCAIAADDIDLQTLRKKAEAGDAEAQYNLGIMTDRGLLSELLNDSRRRTNIEIVLFHLK